MSNTTEDGTVFLSDRQRQLYRKGRFTCQEYFFERSGMRTMRTFEYVRSTEPMDLSLFENLIEKKFRAIALMKKISNSKIALRLYLLVLNLIDLFTFKNISCSEIHLHFKTDVLLKSTEVNCLTFLHRQRK